jgi:hypothetical protein
VSHTSPLANCSTLNIWTQLVYCYCSPSGLYLHPSNKGLHCIEHGLKYIPHIKILHPTCSHCCISSVCCAERLRAASLSIACSTVMLCTLWWPWLLDFIFLQG